MKYSKEFKHLLDHMPNEYIGYGNPNAKILFIGQEPAIDCKADPEQYEREITRNSEQWRTIVSDNAEYGSEGIADYSPLHPYANQKYQVAIKRQNETDKNKVKEGTSRTWYNYQKLVNKIFEAYSNDRKPMDREDYLDFHRLSFHTDMSAASSRKHRRTDEGKKSVRERMPLLSSDFFRNFPIVIAGVGHFPHDSYDGSHKDSGDFYFGHLFDVEYLGNEGTECGMWMNINIKKSDTNPMLLIHTPQFSGSISDQYLDRIAKRVIEFASEHHINLMPDVDAPADVISVNAFK